MVGVFRSSESFRRLSHLISCVTCRGEATPFLCFCSLTSRCKTSQTRGCVCRYGMTHSLPAAVVYGCCRKSFESCRDGDLKRFSFTNPSRKRGMMRTFLKGLILAQNERWRRGLGMQVERIPGGLLSGGSGERGSKAWVTYPGDRDSLPNGRVIPGDVAEAHVLAMRRISPREGLT